MKVCPYCAEEIQDAAIVCKHCGRDLVATAQTVVVQQAPPQRQWSPGVAALLSLVLPGAGQIYKGQVGVGLMWLACTVGGYMMFVVPGLLLHLFCVVTAAGGDPYQTQTTARPIPQSGPPPGPPTRRGAAYGCQSCGRTVRVGDGVCPRCGAAVATSNEEIPRYRVPLAVWLMIPAAVLFFAVARFFFPPEAMTPTPPVGTSEPCAIEAPESFRVAAEQWCQGGIFSSVNVSLGDDTFVTLLKFSERGLAGWKRNRSAVLDRIRETTDTLSSGGSMNVAVSIHDPQGQMIGGCARRLTDRSSTCR